MQTPRHSIGLQRLAVFALLALLPLPAARGQSVTYTTNLPLEEWDWDKTASLPRFDTALGTLQSLDILLDGQISTRYIFDNHRGGAFDLSIYTQGQVLLDGPTTFSTLSVAPIQVDTIPLQPEGVYSNQIDISAQTSVHLTDTADLAPFSGTTDLLLGVHAKNTSYASASTYFTSIVPFEAATVRVTYHYTGNPVPEPSALVLLIAGAFSGVGCLSSFLARERPLRRLMR